MGLDQLVWWRYLRWLGGVLQGDFGRSFRTGETVLGAILARLPVSIELMLLAEIAGLLIGIPLAIQCAVGSGGTFDRVVTEASARGLHVLATPLYTPAWARAAGTDPLYPPSDLARYAAFCSAAVAHFAPLGVHHWEIWNEPNRGFWKPAPDPARYTAMLKLAYAAIKAQDPSAFVVSGGLSPYGSYYVRDGEP